MRKITRDSINAFLNFENFKRGNTEVKVCQTGLGTQSTLYLHGNDIAIKNRTGVKIRNAGWFTNTTKERLNGLPCVNIVQKDFEWYLNGELWEGDLVLVNTRQKGGSPPFYFFVVSRLQRQPYGVTFGIAYYP